MPPDPRHPPGSSIEERLLARVVELERQVRVLTGYTNGGSASQLPVVDSLPPAGRIGRAFVLRSTGTLYVDDGASWIPQT